MRKFILGIVLFLAGWFGILFTHLGYSQILWADFESYILYVPAGEAIYTVSAFFTISGAILLIVSLFEKKESK